MTSVPHNKEELQQAITQAFDKLLAEYVIVPEELSRKIGVAGHVKGSEITVCDTLAYLVGWGRLVLKWYGRKSAGAAVDFPETGYGWHELGRLAQAFSSLYLEWSYRDLVVEWRATTAEILSLVESRSNQELYGEGWYKHYTLGRMIQLNTSSPMKNTRAKLRKFKKINQIK